MKSANECAVQLADVVRLERVKCGHTYLDERITEVSVDVLPLTIYGGVWMYWGREMDAYLTELVQYAATLLDQLHKQVERIQVAQRRLCNKDRPRCEAGVATLEETDKSTIGICKTMDFT